MGQVHTFNDAEFHPLGEIKLRGWRVFYNWLEVVFGVVFLVVMASFTIPQRYTFFQKISVLATSRYPSWQG